MADSGLTTIMLMRQDSSDEDQKDIYIDQIKTVVNEQLSAMDIEPSKFGF